MAMRIEGEKEILIQAAAWLFVRRTRDAKEIAEILNVTERTIRRYAETQTWEAVLLLLRYEGERNFRVRKAGRPRRSTPPGECVVEENSDSRLELLTGTDP